MWKGRSYWKSDLKLHQFVDAIMYLIFLGITKSTDLLIKKWMGQVLKPKQFNVQIKTLFAPVMCMGLEWCKLIHSKAGWISDIFLVFARINVNSVLQY